MQSQTGNTLPKRLNTDFTSSSRYNIPELEISVSVTLINVWCLQGNYSTKASTWWGGSNLSWNVTVTITKSLNIIKRRRILSYSCITISLSLSSYLKTQNLTSIKICSWVYICWQFVFNFWFWTSLRYLIISFTTVNKWLILFSLFKIKYFF